MAHRQAHPTAPAKLTGRDFAVELARLAADTRCRNVALLDVTGISPVSDFLIIATGTSPRQMKTVCDQIEEFAEPLGHRPLGVSAADASGWSLIDFVDVVVHVFSEEARAYYDLDNLWGDAQKLDWKRDEKP